MSVANVLVYTYNALNTIPRPSRAGGHTIRNLCFSLNVIIKNQAQIGAVLKSLTAAEYRLAWTPMPSSGGTE